MRLSLEKAETQVFKSRIRHLKNVSNTVRKYFGRSYGVDKYQYRN